ncbi:non-canonical purine NTP pyrophosphatase, rdgB/HAM1 family [Gluconacetobacter diazotrophicus PA1 5]|uniref:dITP/XTP pyrophosphatase n=2 Tax=Gluconacetobacter diazotrophicus TaxID=33996 RepID=A9HF52_GLUDA|nr:RdgB/HAM1 family non-canonical purine NTP pyrophosphatase [Gluconacetobacter diazotrophicus]ACI51841.1 non-canonical purine NTP pyrophosphatase, rdgB/HAM1 family [Gluconacetobacter diazotrophicus PA1 5]MBB2155604.1 RdgB/HAM1 family non-canonical purine NTP pyrophosphatase [Gluconacetobacter diazotrophicus]TWB11185.1 XTP/dITP diphosphohydrolase [Gluconacetobacter diazotrophicus]CAP55320.1 putative HAM1 protein homolog [Gluconacetobacter diazotrophicus PA1 5]
MSGQATRRLARGDRLVLASHNAGKLVEFSALLDGYGITVLSAGQLGLPEPEETAETFVGNAALKAHAAAQASGLPALADDSGLCVAALGGAPGIYSARWAGPEKDFPGAMARIHEGIGDDPDRSAWFVSVLCLAWPDGTIRSFEGRIDGRITWPPRGTHGHGYDPVFTPEGRDRTFAEMPEAEKNTISHRARAFALFRDACLPGD